MSSYCLFKGPEQINMKPLDFFMSSFQILIQEYSYNSEVLNLAVSEFSVLLAFARAGKLMKFCNFSNSKFFHLDIYSAN